MHGRVEGNTKIKCQMSFLLLHISFLFLAVKSINEAITGLHETITELMNMPSSQWTKLVGRLEEPVEWG